MIFVSEKRVESWLKVAYRGGPFHNPRRLCIFKGQVPSHHGVAIEMLLPGDGRLGYLSVILGPSVKYFKRMLKIAKCIVAEELSLSHLLSSKTSRVSVGNFQRTKYE